MTKELFLLNIILPTRKFGFQRGRSELNRVSDDKSEKEMQFLCIQSILKWQNGMGMQSSKVVLREWSQTVSII